MILRTPSPPASVKEEEKDPLGVSKVIMIPFSIEQCGSLSLMADFLVNRVRSVEELEKMKSSASGVIDFGVAGGMPTYAMNPSDLIDELADRVMSLPPHFPQPEKDDIMAEIEESGLMGYMGNREGEEEEEEANPEQITFEQMSSAGRILERIRNVEQQLTQNKLGKPEAKQSTPVKDLTEEKGAETDSSRRIRKINFFMNGQPIAHNSVVY